VQKRQMFAFIILHPED